jgi:serine/threonine protein kinase/tetratricopeptide (TPR) repeat protein
MNDSDRQIMSVFCEALGHELPQERAAFLDAACGQDVDLRARVESLLQAHQGAGDFLRGHAPATVEGPATERPGVAIGPYKLLEQIGEGGMGTVWLAEQMQPVQRKVALKIIKAGMDSRQVLARFEAERQALALMDHPNIARVLDAGTVDRSPLAPREAGLPLAEREGYMGRPYFVMELVKGQPINKYCDEQRLTPRQRLELFVPVCQAIQHAHQKGIIHRDVKPSNVLVAPFDGKPVVKVIDFGIAKATGQRLTEKTLFTEIGAVVGTLEYMSPEQAELNNQDIDTRSDIYSLGVLLYELLTGSTPLDRSRLKKVAFTEMLRMIREEEPPRPSTRLSESTDSLPSISAQRQMDPAKLTKMVRGELDWIVMKALEKDRNRRYETASAFAADVQRYLADEPVLACPPSVGYRLRKFVRRNKGPVLAASVFVLLLAAGIVGTTTGLLWALEAGRQALQERDDKETARQQAVASAEAEAKARWQTRQALNTMTDEMLEDLLGRQVQLTADHRQFLKKVLSYHEAFAATKGDDLVSRVSRAEGFFALSRIHYHLGELKEAESAAGNAISLWQQLARELSDRPDARINLAVSHHGLGMTLRAAGRLQESEKAHRNALAIRTHLARDFPGRPDFSQAAAISHEYLAVVLSATGRTKEAELEFGKALAIRKQLVAEFPKRADFWRELGYIHVNMGNLLRDTGQLQEAEKAHREALAIWRAWAADHSAPPDRLRDPALTLINLGVLLSDMKRFAEAEKFLDEALVLLKQLAADYPLRPEFRQDLALTYNTLGILFHATARFKQAKSAYGDALTLRERLAADFRTRPGFRQDLARTHNNIGALLVDQKQFGQAKKSYDAALALHKQLAAESPNVPDYQNDLATTYLNLAIRHNHRQEFAAALEFVEKARPHNKAALKANPKNPKYRQAYQLNLRALAWARFGLADHARLATTAEDLARFGFKPATDAFNAALYLCLCVTLAEKDSQLASDKRTELAQYYTERALLMLRQAIARGFKDTPSLKKHRDLNPLRGRQEFKKLLAELEEKQQK